jgi:hypothetical protein
MENYYGLVELVAAAMLIGCWAILEWQGRRLDRKRDAEKAKQQNNP